LAEFDDSAAVAAGGVVKRFVELNQRLRRPNGSGRLARIRRHEKASATHSPNSASVKSKRLTPSRVSTVVTGRRFVPSIACKKIAIFARV